MHTFITSIYAWKWKNKLLEVLDPREHIFLNSLICITKLPTRNVVPTHISPTMHQNVHYMLMTLFHNAALNPIMVMSYRSQIEKKKKNLLVRVKGPISLLIWLGSEKFQHICRQVSCMSSKQSLQIFLDRSLSLEQIPRSSKPKGQCMTWQVPHGTLSCF